MKKCIALAATVALTNAISLFEQYMEKATPVTMDDILLHREDTNLENLATSLGQVINCGSNAYCRNVTSDSDACCAHLVAKDVDAGAKMEINGCSTKTKVEAYQKKPNKNVTVHCLRETMLF